MYMYCNFYCLYILSQSFLIRIFYGVILYGGNFAVDRFDQVPVPKLNPMHTQHSNISARHVIISMLMECGTIKKTLYILCKDIERNM
jgi:hypothetical protein